MFDFARDNEQQVEDQDPGSMVRIQEGDGWVVTVDGGAVAAPEGTVFFENMTTAVVRPVSGKVIKGPILWDPAKDYVRAEIAIYTDVALPTENTTVGALAVGDFVRHSGNGKLYRKVQVLDDAGDEVDAGVATTFVRRIDQDDVIKVSDVTAATKLLVQVLGIKVNP